MDHGPLARASDSRDDPRHLTAPQIAFAIESFGAILDELMPIFQRHYDALSAHGLTLDPNYEFYKKASEAGYLVTYTVRDGGRLCGHALYFSAKNPHHKTIQWANSDSLWIDMDMRRPRVADRFIEVIENDLRNKGVVVMETGTRAAHPALGRLLQARGHEIVNVLYSKRLI